MGENINTFAKYTEPITKLIDVAAKGVGKVYEPIHFARMAKAKAKAINILSDIIRQNSDILKSISVDGLEFHNEDYKLANSAINRFAYQEITKQLNIESVINKAYEELKDENTCSREPIDEDWILRFFNSVQDVSNEQMQQIWAKILAGEIKQPNTFPLRTLDILKNLSQAEAQLFTNICKYIIIIDDEPYIPSAFKLASEMLKNKDLYLLDECGLINSSGLFFKMHLDKETILSNNEKLVITIKNKDKTHNLDLSISFYSLTMVGKAIYKLLYPKITDNQIIDSAKLLQKGNHNIIVQVKKIKRFTNSDYDLDEENLLE